MSASLTRRLGAFVTRKSHLLLPMALAAGLAFSGSVYAAPPKGGMPHFGTGLGGQMVYLQHCSMCHVQSGPHLPGLERAPTLSGLQQLPPEQIYYQLTQGKMQAMGAQLNHGQQVQVAEWLGGRPLGAGTAGAADHMANRCTVSTPVAAPARGDWNGWGNDLGNMRYQPHPGFPTSKVPDLKLKWAFGFPDGAETYSQPTVVGHRVFIGDDNGFMYSINARRGCVQWSFRAHAGIRTAPTVAAMKPGGKLAVFFGDMQGYVYALDTTTGKELWRTRVDDQPMVKVTGAPTVADGRVYVGTTTGEEVTAASPTYACCQTRGTVSSLDAATGKVIWKTYMVPQKPHLVGKTSAGKPRYAPAGVGVWNAPSVDLKKGLIYVGTGDAYTSPASPLSDSVVALSIKTGKPVWHYQLTEKDAWLAGCTPGFSFGNCPKVVGPDWDLGDSPILFRDGSQRLLVGASKGGIVVALDPDDAGKVLWRRELATSKAGAGGDIVFGGASNGTQLFYGLGSSEITALNALDGKTMWRTTIKPDQPHRGGISAAVSVMPGAVFAGSWDGVLRAFSTKTGHLIWSYNTEKPYKTVNGVKSHGGSMGAPGATIAEGMVFVGSGYIGVANGKAGNVLLAFAP